MAESDSIFGETLLRLFVEITEIKDYSDTSLNALNALLPQLSISAKPLSEKELRNIIESKAVHLLLAQENNNSVGTLTLVVFPIITGTRAWIEDVVVSENARGKGVGKLLTKEAIRLAEHYGAKTVDLTSRPTREAANNLYISAGFQRRETNVYRYTDSDKPL